jgi:hypothetical protein
VRWVHVAIYLVNLISFLYRMFISMTKTLFWYLSGTKCKHNQYLTRHIYLAYRKNEIQSSVCRLFSYWEKLCIALNMYYRCIIYVKNIIIWSKIILCFIPNVKLVKSLTLSQYYIKKRYTITRITCTKKTPVLQL